VVQVQTLQNLAGSGLGRTGRNRTTRRGGPIGRATRVLARASGSLWLWHRTILAAHEVGATLPAVTLRPQRQRVLGWGGIGTVHTHFAREVHLPARRLRRRPMLATAYATHAGELSAILEAEYQKALSGPGGVNAPA